MNVCMGVHVCFLISACVEVINELNVGVMVAVSGERLHAQCAVVRDGGKSQFLRYL